MPTRRLPWLLLLGACAGSNPSAEVCDNGSDDDGDGYEDCLDQDCFGAPACTEAVCDDGVDDDLDGQVDCDDPDCAEACHSEGCDGGCDEVCDNGVDDDLDFLVDCADDDCASVCDADGDGWDGLGGPDCDDTRADVNPEAEEVPYDGVDNDCDPVTPDDDLDGDGYLQAEDCDDEVALSYPGAPETCGNGVVDDCEGPADPGIDACFGTRSFSSADVRFTSATPEGWLGSSATYLGDVDDDGAVELGLGMYGDDNASGAVVVVSVTSGGLIDVVSSRAKITGTSEQDWVGEALGSAPKPSRPEINNLLMGARYEDGSASNAGALFVVDGTVGGTQDVGVALSYVSGGDAGDSFGAALGSAGDVDGDGRFDIFVGAPLRTGNDKGGAYLFFGPLPVGQLLAQEASILLEPGPTDGQFGAALAAGGDTNGDGLDDLVVGAPLSYPGGLASAGSVYLYEDLRAPGLRLPSEATGVLEGTAADSLLGSAVAMGDLDNDGRVDVIAGAPGANAVLIARGGTAELSVDVRLDGEGSFGSSLAVGDLNGDGIDDLVVGAPGADVAAGEDAGAAFVFFGPVVESQTPDIIIEGDRPFGFAGHAVVVAPDWTGDGRQELIVGAPFADGGASASGEVAVFWWGY